MQKQFADYNFLKISPRWNQKRGSNTSFPKKLFPTRFPTDKKAPQAVLFTRRLVLSPYTTLCTGRAATWQPTLVRL